VAGAAAPSPPLERRVTSPHWSGIREVTTAWGIKLLFVVHRVLGLWPFRLVVYPVVAFYLLRHPLARVSSRRYLERVYRQLGRDPREVTLWLSVRHFAAFAESILHKLRIWSGDLRTSDVTVHDHFIVNDEVMAGRGGLIMVAHLGNVEVCRALTTRKNGAKLLVLVHTKHAESFNQLLASLNPVSRLNVLQVTEISAATVIHLRERVERGEFVVIAGDRVPVSDKPRVAVAEFLGAPAGFPVGPYILANLLQCPTYLLFCIAESGRYHMYFERFHERIVIPRATRDATLRQLAGDFAARLGHYCQKAPLQWFNFYDFWAPPNTISTDAPG